MLATEHKAQYMINQQRYAGLLTSASKLSWHFPGTLSQICYSFRLVVQLNLELRFCN